MYNILKIPYQDRDEYLSTIIENKIINNREKIMREK